MQGQNTKENFLSLLENVKIIRLKKIKVNEHTSLCKLLSNTHTVLFGPEEMDEIIFQQLQPSPLVKMTWNRS